MLWSEREPDRGSGRLPGRSTVDAYDGGRLGRAGDGYRPNLVARNLRSGRSRLLALVVPEIDVPYFAELARAIIAVAGEHGYHVMIDQTDGDPDRERAMLAGGFQAMPFDGLLFSPISLSAAELRERTRTTPVVLLGEHIFDGSFDHIAIDNVAAATDATEHLLSLGRPPDAVFCFNDLLALGAMKAALDAGLKIPDDLAVVGFDDIEDGRYAARALTTIGPDKRFIATEAVTRLIARVESRESLETREVRAPHTLHVRGSTAGA